MWLVVWLRYLCWVAFLDGKGELGHFDGWTIRSCVGGFVRC